MGKLAALGFGLLYIKRNLRCLYTAELTPLVRIEGSRGAWMHASKLRDYTHSLNSACLGNSYLDKFLLKPLFWNFAHSSS